MRVLIPFSGGLDSTYLAYANLLEGNDIILEYYDILNNKPKSTIEKRACRDIVKTLKKRFDDRYIELNIPNKRGGFKFGVTSSKICMPQPPIWIMGVVFSENIMNVDKVEIGYIIKDTAVSFWDDIKDLYNSYDPFFRINGGDNGLPTLEAPFMKHHKKELWEGLPEELKKKVVFCEKPRNNKRYEPCGRCDCCEDFMVDGLMWEQWHRLNNVKPHVKLERVSKNEEVRRVSDPEYDVVASDMRNEMALSS